jgi:glycosyltransferase involved in cell wall biosynthesis
MSRQPLVSVLMSVHNDLQYLRESVDSILNQTFSDFEFILIDDGSTDGSGDFLKSLQDPRVKLLVNHSNIGLTASLNFGLDLARGKYLARMDADDISEPQRLERQVNFLESHSQIGIVGCSRHLIDEDGKTVAIAPAIEDDLSIRWKCLMGNPFAHPTVMIRRQVLLDNALRYDPSFRTAQDYELWTRLLPCTQAANIAEPLLRYRLRNGISRVSKAQQVANHDRIIRLAIQRLLPGFDLDPADIPQLRGRFGGMSVREPGMSSDNQPWAGIYLKMLDAFCRQYAKCDGIQNLRERIDSSIARRAA